MRKYFNRPMSMLLILALLITLILPNSPNSSAANEMSTEQGIPPSSVTETAVVPVDVNPNVIVAGMPLAGDDVAALSVEQTELEEPISPEVLVPVDPVKPDFTYGPYNSSNTEQVHAYEPFKESTVAEKDQQKAADFKKDQLLIKMFPNAMQDNTFSAQSVTVPFADQGVLSLEPLMPEKTGMMSAQAVDANTDVNEGVWYKAGLQEGTDVLAAASAISSQTGVFAAEPDYIRSTMADGIPDATTDDKIADQWQLERSAVKQAWSYLQTQGINPGGSRDVVVAVIDTGVDYTHPDLVGNMWTNSGEIAGNGIDDDNNGYIDDVHGACTVGDQWNGESGNPMDDHGHGTHVAGIIAAAGGNGGAVGVAYNVQIMAIKAGQSSGIFSSSDIAQAIYYAVQNGADVINMSFGGYGRSTVEEDALQVAFGTSVMVAAAGNDSIHNDPRVVINNKIGKPMYPAAYPWVLGVMAERTEPAGNGDNLAGFSNWDYIAQDSYEYEVMAPGVDILSTLPGGKYASWSGTSMATPIVSGIAALVRSKYADKESYSSRFIMGQIASTGDLIQGKTYSLSKSPIYYKEVNAFKALTENPEPQLSYLEHYVFDTSDIAEKNNADGVIDAGETINLAIVIRNHWGKADNVQVEIDAVSPGNIPDPYVEFVTDSVDYGAVGNFGTDDNGFIYDEEGPVIGVLQPFQIRVAANTPNDHVIPIKVTITGKNGFNTTDLTIYSTSSSFNLMVRNGTVLPRVISDDMTLTKNTYWIIPDRTLIEEGVTVTVEPGTQIQFWGSDPSDPYADQQIAYLQVEGNFFVNGTPEEPVEIFPSALYAGYVVQIGSTRIQSVLGNGYDYKTNILNGYSEIKYAKITNPTVEVNSIQHCSFNQNDLFVYKKYLGMDNTVYTLESYGPIVTAADIKWSNFYKLGFRYTSSWPYSMFKVKGNLKGNLFDSCALSMGKSYGDYTSLIANDNVFLKNYRLDGTLIGDRRYMTSKIDYWGYPINLQDSLQAVFPVYREENATSYFALRANLGLDGRDEMQIIQKFARSLNGDVISINDLEENEFIRSYLQNYLNNTDIWQQDYPALNQANFSDCYTIGFNDIDEEGNYRWISGQEVSFSNWSDTQPNKPSTGTYNMVQINRTSGQWNSVSNSSQNRVYLIEVPGEITKADVDNARNTFVENGGWNTFSKNAILNDWIDLDLDHWMRFWALEDRTALQSLQQNYWGTTSSLLIGKSIVDYIGGDFNRASVQREPILTEAPETCYPFVTDVYMSTETEERATRVGAESIQVNVLFNRDMASSTQPQVSFGPDMPTTDYTVNGVEGGWTTPRHWVGEFNITPLTGDGYQFFRVAGAVAADDPWLVTGNDSERFRFEIITSGTEAMNLQASGGEGKVLLSWTQDDFDVLAGYNIYRSNNVDGTYTKINSTLIPSDQKSYEDTQVQPGQPYYYKFTIVKTDLSESVFSNVASGTPLDTIAPVIYHDPVSGTAPGLGLTLFADVTDNVRVASVKLYYRKTGTTVYSIKDMTKTTGDRYAATIEGINVQAPGIDYYIQVSDGISIVRNGNATSPNQVAITDAPKVTSVSPVTGSQSGGTSVVITGTNFKTGASLTFDGAAASSVVVENANRITATTPAHFPATVDVCVTNSDGYKDTMLRAFTYISEGVEVSMPAVNANHGQMFEIPISISAVQGLRSADLKISFDKEVLAVNSVRLGNLTAGFTLDANQTTPGELILALASSTSVSGTGNLAMIEFQVLDGSKTESVLHFEEVQLNSGAIVVNASDAAFTVTNTHSVSGSIYYYSNSQAINNVDLSLSGAKTYTASSSNGAYSISGAEIGAYQLKASKSDEATAISAYDAAMILQAKVASINLSNQQKIAADVDKNGDVDSLDASYVLEQAVGLRTLPFPGQGQVWAFEPAERSYSTLETDLTNENFTGILIGDVSGNWGSGGTGIQSIDSTSFTIEEVSTPAASKVTVPVKIDAGSGNVYAVDLVISYDQNVATALEVKKSSASSNFAMSVNLTTPGKIRIAMASSQPLTGLSELLNIDFQVIANPGEETVIEIEQAAANEKLATAIQNGKLIINTTEGCFIATAAFGSYLDPHVYALRQFRDQVLLHSVFGRWFVAAYYHISPPIAAYIAQHQSLKVITRLLLTPLILVVEFPITGAFILIILLIGMILNLRRKRLQQIL